MTDLQEKTIRELDQRSFDGIEVSLFWCEEDGSTFVVVNDSKKGEAFTVNVPANTSAHDVFHHPYAYRD